MAYAHVSFDLTRSEQARLARIAAPTTYPTRVSIGSGAATVVSGVIALILASLPHHTPWMMGFGVYFCAMGLYLALRSYRALNGRGVPARVSLEVTDAGLSGTIDGVSAAIRWQDISGVRECADAYAVDLRKVALRPIAIPKAALVDPAAFWALCEDHLIAKRGLVRPAYPRTRIVNTACSSVSI